MRRIGVSAIAVVLVVTVLTALVAAGPGESDQQGLWSKPVSGLAGRLRVSKSSITADGQFRLTLELANRGRSPLAVQCGDPICFTLTVLDAKGEKVEAPIVRAEVLSSPQWGVIPGGSYLGLPVSYHPQNRAANRQLDITTDIWTLKPGKYRLVGSFASNLSSGVMKFLGSPGKAAIWKGKIKLPPLDVEVLEKK